jgi:hypothetical protein
MPNDDLFDSVFKGIGDAIADVREKVIEEPWFGRAVAGPETDAPQWPQAREPEPEREQGHEQEQEPQLDSSDIDLDR